MYICVFYTRTTVAILVPKCSLVKLNLKFFCQFLKKTFFILLPDRKFHDIIALSALNGRIFCVSIRALKNWPFCGGMEFFMKDKKKIGLILMYLSFGIVMAGLGANDALRGVFSPIFKDHFTLSSVQISMIIVMSYAGNLIFLWAGTRLADRFEKKKVMMGILLIWMAALLVYVTTDNYYVLLITMLFTMGASTLMNTMINLFVPMYFAAPGLIVNTLFFVQGIGTTGSQMILGQVATGFPWWQKTNLLLFSLGLIGLILFLFAGKKAVVLKSETTDAKNDFDSASKAKVQMNSPILWLLVLVFGFYFIGEHGVLNWLLLYCKDQFGMDSNQASIYLSMFSGTMMIGRLVMAPLVQKLGPSRSIQIFGGIGTVLYAVGIFCGKPTLMLVGISGLFVSILYPTLLLFVQQYYPSSIASTATGTIISIATIFDIAFNLLFGKIIDQMGYHLGFMILPVSMIIFYLIVNFLIKKYKPLRNLGEA